jgi:predicted alpha/beta-hydrolase family hydrolase
MSSVDIEISTVNWNGEGAETGASPQRIRVRFMRPGVKAPVMVLTGEEARELGRKLAQVATAVAARSEIVRIMVGTFDAEPTP